MRSAHSANYRGLLKLLRQLREDAGLSQTDVAERLRRPQTWVSKVELGERRLDVEELRQLCLALDADVLSVVRMWLRVIDR